MSAGRETEITRRMSALRTQGTRVAAQLPRDLDRARDWREHVRAHPIPAVMAAAALGFVVVPARRCEPKAQATNGSAKSSDGAANKPAATEALPTKAGLLASPVVAAVGAWAGRWALATATGALQRLAAEHLHSLPTGFTKHGSAPSQRRSDTTEQRRARPQ